MIIKLNIVSNLLTVDWCSLYFQIVMSRVIFQMAFRGGEANFDSFVFSFSFLEKFDEIFDQLSER